MSFYYSGYKLNCSLIGPLIRLGVDSMLARDEQETAHLSPSERAEYLRVVKSKLLMSFHAPSKEKVTMEVRQDESSSWNVDASRTDEYV